MVDGFVVQNQITNVRELTAVIDAALGTVPEAAAARLIALRAQMEALQLGTGRIHLRVNAAQIATVISRELNLDTDDEIVKAMLLTRNGATVSERLK